MLACHCCQVVPSRRLSQVLLADTIWITLQCYSVKATRHCALQATVYTTLNRHSRLGLLALALKDNRGLLADRSLCHSPVYLEWRPFFLLEISHEVASLVPRWQPQFLLRKCNHTSHHHWETSLSLAIVLAKVKLLASLCFDFPMSCPFSLAGFPVLKTILPTIDFEQLE